MGDYVHKSVLLQEVLTILHIQPNDVIFDATINGGGHSSAICKRLTRGRIIGTDRDSDALARARVRLAKCNRQLDLVESDFRDLDKVLSGLNLKTADKYLFDLGLSSNQFEDSGRGFSFQKNEPLLMTFATKAKNDAFTAGDIVNEWDEENIADVIFGYGEERFAKKIARGIVTARSTAKIKDTFALVEIIENSVPFWYKKRRIHPATKTFQALRIAVNDELRAVESALEKAFDHLSPHGRIAVISFHSLEDRIVKHFFKKKAEDGEAVLLTKKPVIASDEEQSENPRSRSAKLRAIENKP